MMINSDEKLHPRADGGDASEVQAPKPPFELEAGEEDGESPSFNASNKPELDQGAGVNPPSSSPQLDGGYGWVVVFASFLAHFFVLGNIYSFGLFFRIYLEEFDASFGEVAWIGSIGTFLLAALGMVSGNLADRYGNGRIICVGAFFVGAGMFAASFATSIWQLYLTQGIISGVGFSLSYISAVSVVGQWFDKRRALAVGIAVAGSGFGQLGLSFIIAALTDAFGWRVGLRYLAALDFVGLFMAGVLTRRSLPRYIRPEGESFLRYFGDRNFCLMFFFGTFVTMGLFMPFTYLPKYAEIQGLTDVQIVLIIALSGLFSAVGRVMVGFAADRFGRLQMMIVCVYGAALSTYAWMGLTTFAPLLVYALLYSCFAGGIISLIPVIAAELFGIEQLGRIVGFLYTSSSVGNLIGAPIAGFLVDLFGDYLVAIAVAATFLLISSFSLFFIRPLEQTAKVAASTAPATATAADDDGVSSDVEMNTIAAKEDQQHVISESKTTDSAGAGSRSSAAAGGGEGAAADTVLPYNTE